jgi:AbrB family looped-hinge helix DNA binding protein
MELVSVSSKGQIAIPKEVRERLGIREGMRLKLSDDGNRIMLEKDLGDWRSLRGLAAGTDLLSAYAEDKENKKRRESLRP